MEGRAGLRGHTKSAIQANGCAIEHSILDDRADQMGELFGSAKAGGEGDALREVADGSLGQLLGHRSVEEA